MGNFASTPSSNSSDKKFNNLTDIIDNIATDYILTTDFNSMKKLTEKEYCDKLVVITSDIIERHFNDMEVTFLAQRVKKGVDANDLQKNVVINELKKEKVIFINDDKLKDLDISNDAQKSIKKKRVCIGIAKFYIKIAHIFAAIMMTINPVYVYKDANGETTKTGLMGKKNIPKNTKPAVYFNICDNRINALTKGEKIDETTGNITMQPKICDMNVSETEKEKTLDDEPGIDELLDLYLDDTYDYSTGTFTGMSNNTKTQFMKDLKLFYTTFTGNEEMPSNITKFSDIKLQEYDKQNRCMGDKPSFKQKYTINKNDKLFVNYATNTQKMIQTARTNQQKLLSVINDIFTNIIDPYSGKKVIRINPKLTDELLQKSVEKARKFIVDLYIKCESDYVNGVKLYQAIVESKILQTTINQIKTLDDEKNKTMAEYNQIKKPIKDSNNNLSLKIDTPNVINDANDQNITNAVQETNEEANEEANEPTIENTVQETNEEANEPTIENEPNSENTVQDTNDDNNKQLS